jgi:carbonic anhydrase
MNFLKSVPAILILATVGCRPTSETISAQKTAAEIPKAHNSATAAAHTKHWGYSSQIIVPPAKWVQVDERCNVDSAATNKPGRQSPVNLSSSTMQIPPKNLAGLRIKYMATKFDARHNGHTIVFTPDNPDLMVETDDGKEYRLLQFHLHAASEHTIDGKQLGAEVHFVHSLKSDIEGTPLDERNLLVFGVLLNADPNSTERNPLLPAELVDVIVKHREDSKIHPIKTPAINPLGKLSSGTGQNGQQEVRLTNLLHYQGSLTTPPCSENVQWYVDSKVLNVTTADIKALQEAIGFDNSRPIIGSL